MSRFTPDHRPCLRTALVGLLFLLAAGATGVALAGEAAVMIVDASGSMAARLGTETRLDAARRVLLDRLAGWKPDTRLALVAYGHRRPSDCADIETLVPLGPIDLARTKRRLGDLRARGMTPLSAALRHAAGLLPKDGGTIFLVSDGLETCKEDPCAVARSLRAANAHLVIHVVGFGILEDEKQALACIAAEGGGQMASAADAKALSSALTGLAAASGVATAPLPAPESPPAPPSKPVEPVPPPEPPPGPVPVAFHAVAAGTDALAGVPLGLEHHRGRGASRCIGAAARASPWSLRPVAIGWI